jgi:CubicO group peptidase (beta-lactamase class C family)
MVVLALGSLCGCAQLAATDVQHRAEPFMLTRDRAVSAVVSARRVLPSASLGRFQACYSDVQSKANAYGGFLIALASDGTYDDATNATLAQQLGLAIGAFDDCELKLQRSNAALAPTTDAGGTVAQPSLLPVLSTDWVSGFSTSVAGYWRRDQRRMQALSPAEKYDMIRNLNAALMWPDFDQIQS